jgi:hypothetical protein
MKYILSACPIHRGCTIQVVFGKESDGRIPFRTPPSSRSRSETSQVWCRLRRNT